MSAPCGRSSTRRGRHGNVCFCSSFAARASSVRSTPSSEHQAVMMPAPASTRGAPPPPTCSATRAAVCHNMCEKEQTSFFCYADPHAATRHVIPVRSHSATSHEKVVVVLLLEAPLVGRTSSSLPRAWSWPPPSFFATSRAWAATLVAVAISQQGDGAACLSQATNSSSSPDA